VGKLLARIQQVGQRLMEAQPREMVVGNIVRRVLGMIRDEAREDRARDYDDYSDSGSSSHMESFQKNQKGATPERLGVTSSISTFSPLRHSALKSMDLSNSNDGYGLGISQENNTRLPLVTSHTSYAVMGGVPVQQSMLNLLSATASPVSSGAESPTSKALSYQASVSNRDLRAEISTGIEEIIDEINQADDQIAGYAVEHVHSNEIILTHSSSRTVQKFLLKAASNVKFTVIHVESYPNDHENSHAMVMRSQQNEGEDGEDDDLSTDDFEKPLTAAGITVIVITDAAVFALMSRVNKVILATHAVIANGGLIAAAGARIIAKAANRHRTPVIVVSGVYKLSPEYPFEFESLIEYGNAGKVLSYEDGDLVDKLEVDNPLFDYVPPELVDLYVTNL
jgi:translation initiation factor eIF-2B subunit beta